MIAGTLSERTMRIRSTAMRIAAAALLATALVSPAAAADSQLPASTVEASGGAQVPLSDLGSSHWLLVYVVPESRPSTRLIDALRAWELPTHESLVFVVGGSREEAARFAAADHGLPGARWAIDPAGDAWRDLQLSGAPSLFGIEQAAIRWRLAGVLNDPQTFKSVVVSWLQR
jgi:hypothetical protein